MKITKLTLNNFRAFSREITFDLKEGKNFLLYGENGSGKSSLFHAIDQFFNEFGTAREFSDFKNIFCPEIKGSIDIELDNNRSWSWYEGGNRPTGDADFVDACIRKGCLEYRSLLKINFVQYADFEESFFFLASKILMSRIQVPIAGGQVKTIGELSAQVFLPSSHRPKIKDNAIENINRFNQAFKAVLPEVERKASEILGHFLNHQIEFSFEFQDLNYNPKTRKIENERLGLAIKFNGKEITEFDRFLNEARLSALSLSIYLASILLSAPEARPGQAPLKLLVLDDVLIGLDMNNRMPVLKILKSFFEDYQIFLITHNQVWFDLARGHLPESSGWLHRELRANQDAGHLIPTLRPSVADLARSKQHLDNGDLKAAAVYARSAFEWKLRTVCEKYGIKIPFKSDADTVGAGVLWDGIIFRQREREEQREKGTQVPDFVPLDLETQVETMKSTVLNKLSHTGSSGLTSGEVKIAIDTVEKIHNHLFQKSKTNHGDSEVS